MKLLIVSDDASIEETKLLFEIQLVDREPWGVVALPEGRGFAMTDKLRTALTRFLVEYVPPKLTPVRRSQMQLEEKGRLLQFKLPSNGL